MSELINLIYVTLDENDIAVGITESYTMPEGNNISLGKITWDEVDMTILSKKLVDGEWIPVNIDNSPEGYSTIPPKPDSENDYVWSEEKQEWITLEEFEELLGMGE